MANCKRCPCYLLQNWLHFEALKLIESRCPGDYVHASLVIGHVQTLLWQRQLCQHTTLLITSEKGSTLPGRTTRVDTFRLQMQHSHPHPWPTMIVSPLLVKTMRRLTATQLVTKHTKRHCAAFTKTQCARACRWQPMHPLQETGTQAYCGAKCHHVYDTHDAPLWRVPHTSGTATMPRLWAADRLALCAGELLPASCFRNHTV
jgi:hypothetical protein